MPNSINGSSGRDSEMSYIYWLGIFISCKFFALAPAQDSWTIFLPFQVVGFRVENSKADNFTFSWSPVGSDWIQRNKSNKLLVQRTSSIL